MAKIFWSWVINEIDGSKVEELRIDGYIGEESWFYDTATPEQLRRELDRRKGDLTVWINSGGGECFAAAEMYNMIKEYSKTKGKIAVKIDALAASAASVIAMAGDTILMSPVSLMMIHNPATFAMGEVADFEKAINALTEVKQSIINAYIDKTGLTRKEISDFMDSEKWLNAKAAVELGFASGLLYDDSGEVLKNMETQSFNRRTQGEIVASAFNKKFKPAEPPAKGDISVATKLYERLYDLKI